MQGLFCNTRNAPNYDSRVRSEMPAPLEDFSQAANQAGFCARWLPTNLKPEKAPQQVKEWPR